MGKKVNPYGLRVGISKPWRSRWYAKGVEYVNNIHQDLGIKKIIKSNLKDAGIAEIIIERFAESTTITIATSRPGVVIGRQGSSLDLLRGKIITFMQNRNVDIKVAEIRKPEMESALVAQNIARQIERRFPYRRACKQAVEKAREAGVKGIKVKVGGRLNGAEIARSETFSEGRIPLQTIRANIDYASESAETTYGKIGIKVWLYKGDVFADRKKQKEMKRFEHVEVDVKDVEKADTKEKSPKETKSRDNIIDSAIEI